MWVFHGTGALEAPRASDADNSAAAALALGARRLHDVAASDTRLYAGPDLDFYVQVLLEAAEVPWGRLSCADPEGPRLGWDLWVRNVDFEQPADDAVFSLDTAEDQV